MLVRLELKARMPCSRPFAVFDSFRRSECPIECISVLFNNQDGFFRQFWADYGRIRTADQNCGFIGMKFEFPIEFQTNLLSALMLVFGIKPNVECRDSQKVSTRTLCFVLLGFVREFFLLEAHAQITSGLCFFFA